MNQQKAFLVCIHRYAFRAGEPAEILGMYFCTPTGEGERLCYHIKFEDGKEDFVSVSDQDHYRIINEADVKAGCIPGVTE